MNEKRSGECEYCGHIRYTNDLFNGECVPCVTWAEDLINALTAEVKRLKSKRICACGATVEELVIGEVTYRTNASSTNAKLMADVALLQAELEKYVTPLTDEQAEHLASYHDNTAANWRYLDGEIRAAREGER